MTSTCAPRLRPESILRERIVAVLERGADRPLTVLCAPAGYGKTTAVAQWLERSGPAYAWLALDEQDNDPSRLGARLLERLGVAGPGDLQAAERAFAAGADFAAAVLPLALQAIGQADGGRFVLVLDDYHLVTNRACHDLTLRLLDALPQRCRVVITTRTVPPLRLARRRSAGQVAELGADQLRFDLDETERLLNGSLAFALDPGQLALIEERVEGWPAGVALVASALQDRPDQRSVLDLVAASHANLDAYLTEEVLDAARPQLRDFLCRSAPLALLHPALCDAVLDDPAAPELLEEVRAMSLFVTTVDPDGPWLRYHPVLRATLLRELRRREPELEPELLRRASDWLAQNGRPDEAIEAALAAGDGPRAAALLSREWLRLLNDRRSFTISRILDRLPADRGAFGPLCDALRLLCLLLGGADQRLTLGQAHALARDHGDDPMVRVIVDSLLVSPFYGDIAQALAAGADAWARYAALPPVQARLVGPYALTQWFAGDRPAVRALLEPRLTLDDPPFTRVWTLAVLALAAADDGDASGAVAYARRANALVAELGAQTATEFTAVPLVLGETLRAAGDLSEARPLVAHAVEAEARRPGSIGHALALTFDAGLALDEGNLRRARAQAARARTIVDGYPDTGTLTTRLAAVEARLAAIGDPLLGTEPTEAERRVLALLDGDRSLAQIAAALYLSPNTVKSHARRLYRRFGQHSRAGVVAAARARGVLDD